LVGVVAGSVGHRPFDRRAWSGSCRYFFTALADRGLLHRAFGARVGAPRRHLLLARNFRRERWAWRHCYYSDPGYRDALTEQVRRRLRPEDIEPGRGFLQIGAMCDVPRLLGGRAKCFAYLDGNIAETLNNPFRKVPLEPRDAARAMAFERRVYHGMDRVFTMSEYTRWSLIQNFDLPEDRVVTIGAGINFDAAPEPVPDKRYDGGEVLFIGVDFARKGGWELLRAFRAVRGRHPGARLHVVGPSRLRVPPALARGVEFHGRIDRGDPAGAARLDGLLRRSCLFVMPSLYEPFGIAPLEAMAHQVPAVVSNAWALRESVSAGVTGALVEPGNVADLAETMTALLGDPESLRRMGESARAAVIRDHHWPAVADRLAEALRAAPSRPTSPARDGE
jgi:glycosyltransferase involved in cell wall biosynthesis